MNATEPKDRLIEVDLEELLGGKAPPDLTEGTLARLDGQSVESPRRGWSTIAVVSTWLMAAMLLAAALIALGVFTPDTTEHADLPTPPTGEEDGKEEQREDRDKARPVPPVPKPLRVSRVAWSFPDRARREPKATPWPRDLYPPVRLAAGTERVYVLDRDAIWSLDLSNGKRVWRAPIDENLALPRRSRPVVREWRHHADPTGQDLVVVGSEIYSIQRTAPPGVEADRPLAWRNRSVLRVYDLTRTYRSFDGAAEIRRDKTYWLAGPAFDTGQLYLPAESAGWHLMVGIDRVSRGVVWTERIARIARAAPAAGELGRRAAAGSRPVLTKHGLVWVTHEGRVVCLDPKTGKQRWAHEYARLRPGAAWAGLSDPMPAGDKLIVLPRDGRELLCLDIRTGKRLWARARADLRLLVGVRSGRVIAQGDALVALDIGHGRRLVKSPPIVATGRPVWFGGLWVVPTVGGLVCHDLRTLKPVETIHDADLRRTVRRSNLPGEFPPLGHLAIPRPGLMMSLHHRGVLLFGSEAFWALREKQADDRVKQDPENPKVWYRRGELHLQRGSLDDALTAFTRCRELATRRGPRIYVNLARGGMRNVYVAMHYRTARTDPLEKAIGLHGLDEDRVLLELRKAEALALGGSHDKALAIYDRLVKWRVGAEPVLTVDDRGACKVEAILAERVRRATVQVRLTARPESALRNEVAKLTGTPGIPALLNLHRHSESWAMLAYVAAREAESAGRIDDAVVGYRELLRHHAGTRGALGALRRWVVLRKDRPALTSWFERHAVFYERKGLALPPDTLAELKALWK